MLIVLLDEAVGAVRTGLVELVELVELVVGREWLREPVAGVVVGRGARCVRAVLVVILVVISSCVSSDSRGGGGLVPGRHASSRRSHHRVGRFAGSGR
jgi:hypothetical protein